MWDVIVGLWQSFIPPLHASPEAQYNWRVRVGVFTCLAFTGLCALAAVSYGLVPQVDGFAKAGDLNKQVLLVINEVRGNRVEQIENELLNLRLKHCAAIKAGSEEAKILYWSKISERMTSYQQLTGRVYQLPQCSDL